MPAAPNRPVVLVVDDEALNVSAFARALRGELDVRTAASAHEALAALEQGGIEVLITDYRMPGMDGLQLLAEAARRWPALPRLLVSGQDCAEVHAAAETGLAFAVILKPWDRAQMVEAVHRALGPGRPRDPPR